MPTSQETYTLTLMCIHIIDQLHMCIDVTYVLKPRCISLLMQAEGWISEKLTVATDESYRDPTNLQSKLQKHQAFEAELSANKGRVDSVTEVIIIIIFMCRVRFVYNHFSGMPQDCVLIDKRCN